MKFTNLDDLLHIRLGKTLRNYVAIMYYNILMKINNREDDGAILARVRTLNRYWEEKERIADRNHSLCSKMRVYYGDLGRYIHTIEEVLNRRLTQKKLKRKNFFLKK